MFSKWQFSLRTLFLLIAVLSCILATTLFVYDRHVRQPRRLFLAAEAGDGDTIRRLLSHGATVPKQNSFDQTPLMFSCLNGHLEATKVLVEAGSPINERHRYGFTPLMYAAVAGHLEVVEYLVAQGADPTLLTDSNYSALYYAKGNRHLDVVAFLEGVTDVQE